MHEAWQCELGRSCPAADGGSASNKTTLHPAWARRIAALRPSARSRLQLRQPLIDEGSRTDSVTLSWFAPFRLDAVVAAAKRRRCVIMRYSVEEIDAHRQ